MAQKSRKRSWFSSILPINWLFTVEPRAPRRQWRRFDRLCLEALEDRVVPSITTLPMDLKMLGMNLQNQLNSVPITDSMSAQKFELDFKQNFTQTAIAPTVSFLQQFNPIPEQVSTFLTTSILSRAPSLDNLVSKANTVISGLGGTPIPTTPMQILTDFAKAEGHPEVQTAFDNLKIFFDLNKIQTDVNAALNQPAATPIATQISTFDNLFSEIKSYNPNMLPLIDEFNKAKADAGGDPTKLATEAQNLVDSLSMAKGVGPFITTTVLSFSTSADDTGSPIQIYQTPDFPLVPYGFSIGAVSAGATFNFSLNAIYKYSIAFNIDLMNGFAFTSAQASIGVGLSGDANVGIDFFGFSVKAADLKATLAGTVGIQLHDPNNDGMITASELLSEPCYFDPDPKSGVNFSVDATYIDPTDPIQYKYVLGVPIPDGPKHKTTNLVNVPLWNPDANSCMTSDQQMAGIASVTNGVLSINGTPQDDTIKVTLDNSDPNNLMFSVYNDGMVLSFPVAGVTMISINTYAGNDTATVAPDITIPCTITGGTGNKTFTGGGGDDVITAGDGTNVLDGGPGNDTLVAGNGTNTFLVNTSNGGTKHYNGGTGTNIILVQGTQFDDNISIVTALPDPNVMNGVAFTINGVTQNDTYKNINIFQILGGAGNDRLNLDFKNGSMIPSGGIYYDGGAGANNSLNLFDSPDPFTNELETPFGPTSGQISFDNGPPINYTNVNSIDDTTAITGTATYQGTPNSEALNIVNGGMVNGFQATQLNSTNPLYILPQTTFATVFFANKPNVIIDGLGGNDVYALNNPLPAAGMTSLTMGQTGDVGNNQFNVQTPFPVAAGVTFNVVGGIGVNTLVGPALPETYNVTGTNAGNVTMTTTGDVVNSFTRIQNLTGGQSDDTFTFTTAGVLSGKINGGGQSVTGDLLLGDTGADTFTINGPNAGAFTNAAGITVFTNIEDLKGGTGTDTFAFATGGSLQGTITGQGPTFTNNTIIGNNAGASFVIKIHNGGNIAGILPTGFIGIGNLKGGTGDDTFTFWNNGTLDGTINGGGAGPQGDTIVGNNNGDTFTISGTNQGNIVDALGNKLLNLGVLPGFTAIQNLTGGNQSNTFLFSGTGQLTAGGILNGGIGSPNTIIGAGSETFTITGPNAGTITGTIAGKTANVLSDFLNVQNLEGGGTDTFTFFGSGTLTGGITDKTDTAANTIIGNDAGDSFFINGGDSGTITGLLGTGGFADIGTLIGGLGSDVFTFVDAGLGNPGTLKGTISGGTAAAGPNNTNTIVGNNDGDAFAINGATPNSGSIAGVLPVGFSNIQNLTGGTADDTFTFTAPGKLTGQINGGGQGPNGDLIVGDGTARLFTITGSNAGTIGTLLPAGWVNVQNLQGGSGSDTFKFFGSGALTGGITGGGAIGGAGDTNTIIGNDAGDQFIINGGINPAGPFQNAGTIVGLLGTGGFFNIANLKGGLGNDTFTFVSTTPAGGDFLSGAIDGGGGNNTIVGDNSGDSFQVTGANQGNIPGLLNVSAGLAVGFNNIQNLTGGTFDDTFTFRAPGKLTGHIDGGGQGPEGDTVIGDNTTEKFTIFGTNAGSITNILPNGFSNIQNLTGGNTGNETFTFTGAGLLTGVINGGSNLPAAQNTIIGNNVGDNFVLDGGPDQDNPVSNAGFISNILNNGFVAVQNLTGGTGADTFAFEPNGSITGTVNGGPGRNSLDYSQFNLQVTVNLLNGKGTATGIGTNFISIENAIGSPLLETPVGPPFPSNTLIGENNIPTGDVWKITGPDSGSVNMLRPPVAGGAATVPDVFTFSGFQNLTGGSANPVAGTTNQDVFRFYPGGSVQGTITGNAADSDWLDYTPIPSGVKVNLSILNPNTGLPGVASLIGTNVIGVNDVLGSAGGGDTLIGNTQDNVLVARVGHNTINGAGGRNIIITGQGVGTVYGGTVADAAGNIGSLIVAGRTLFDNNIPALTNLQATWTAAAPFQARVNAVKAVLNQSTVILAVPPGPRIGYGGGFLNPTIYVQGGQSLLFVRWTSLIVDFNTFRNQLVTVSWAVNTTRF